MRDTHYHTQRKDAIFWINALDAVLKRLLWIIIPVSIQMKRICVLIAIRKYTGIWPKEDSLHIRL